MMDHCWNQVGVWGNRDCADLQQHLHCRNCPVYVQVGQTLLDRPAPQDYLDLWGQVLQSPREQITSSAPCLSLMVFQIGQEWMALPASCFRAVIQVSPIHSLPHRSNEIFLGIVNVRGELLLCISLHALFGMESHTEMEPRTVKTNQPRFVIVEQGDVTWVFRVDQLHGLHRFDMNLLRTVPVALSADLESCSQGLLPWQNQTVNYLNEQRLFSLLKQKAL